jgi:trigger factor
MSTIIVEKTAEDLGSKSLRVTVPVDRVREAETRALRYYGQRAKLPGFRPGKAPEAVIRKRFGDAIRQSILEEVIREGWETARSTESLKPIADPSIRNVKFEEGTPIEFELLVEVKPEIALSQVSGFRAERRRPEVPDSAVDEQLYRLQEQKASWVPVEGEKPAPGQMARVEVAPIENGTAGSAQPYDLVLGQNQAIPDLEERVMSLLPGETVDAEVRFPDDHPDASRRGQSRQVRITLHDVKRQELPALDDAFAREVGDFDTLDALRAAVRQDLEGEADRQADADVREQIVRQIAEANGVQAPHTLVHRRLHAFANMYQVPEAQLAQFEQEFQTIVEAQVRRDLVLDTVAEAENLRATEADIDARVAQIAESRGVSANEVYASLQKSKRLPELEHAITEEKVFAFLLAQSTVDEVKA